MLLTILCFELRLWLRGLMVWIFFLVIAVAAVAATTSEDFTIADSLQNTVRNAPFVIQRFYSIASILTVLMTTVFVTSAATRDFSSRFDQILFALPIRKRDYLLGRFAGATIVALIPMLGISVGILLAEFMPWVKANRFGFVNWDAHGLSILTVAVPNTLITAAILFSVAILTRSQAKSFVAAVMLLVAYGCSMAFLANLNQEWIAAWADPFGIQAAKLVTKHFTVSEKSNLIVGFEPLLIGNRILWLTIAAICIGVAYLRFQFSQRAVRERARWSDDIVDSPPHSVVLFQPQLPSSWKQFVASWNVELRALIRTPAFLILAAALLTAVVLVLIFTANAYYGNHMFPVTFAVVALITRFFFLFGVAYTAFFAGQLVWNERESRTHEWMDALPRHELTAYLAKLAALSTAIFSLLSLTIVVGVVIQAAQGYTRFQLGLYVESLLINEFSQWVFWIVAALFCQTIFTNKNAGYFAFVAFVIFKAIAWEALDVTTNMVKFGGRPDFPYSDFYGFAPIRLAWIWFTLYWSLACILIAAVTLLFWTRGNSKGNRWRIARRRFRGTLRKTALLTGAAFAVVGSWVFYNTQVLNPVPTPGAVTASRAAYEKAAKKFSVGAQPRITSVRYRIDIFPETRNMVMRGTQTILNNSHQSIEYLYLTVSDTYETDIRMGGAELVTSILNSPDREVPFRVYRLKDPMLAGESRLLEFTVKSKFRGFSDSVIYPDLRQNGTFFSSNVAPKIGYQPDLELYLPRQRARFELPDRRVEANPQIQASNNDADWVAVSTTICTSPDQTAIAPGSLVKQWAETGGRQCFEYRLDRSSPNLYSFMSARYEVARELWNGVSIEVYYHPDHKWNVPKMLSSIRKTLDYGIRNFGPYAHRQARIIEFPQVQHYAQAFPGTMPYSEGFGFVANLESPDAIDNVFFVVAHEMAHQWWGYQLAPAFYPGSTTLSETLAEYTALMVMEKEYGRDMMHKFLAYELDNYLRGRGRQEYNEYPLLYQWGQYYVHYSKGSLVMYLLKETIGEETINAVLRDLLAKHAFKGPPYPIPDELFDGLAARTPPEFQNLLKDLFKKVILFGNRTYSAEASKRPDGKYLITVDVEARKFQSDGEGFEVEIPVDDWIEIGAFTKPGRGEKYGRPLYRERIHMESGRRTFTFVTDELPDKAGIDPYSLLIDRDPHDNLLPVEH